MMRTERWKEKNCGRLYFIFMKMKAFRNDKIIWVSEFVREIITRRCIKKRRNNLKSGQLKTMLTKPHLGILVTNVSISFKKRQLMQWATISTHSSILIVGKAKQFSRKYTGIHFLFKVTIPDHKEVEKILALKVLSWSHYKRQLVSQVARQLLLRGT